MSDRIDSHATATREARRMAKVLREVGGHGAPIGDSGWMACDSPGSWADFAAGLGLAGPVGDDVLDALVAWYADQGRPARIQTTPYQHRSLHEGLAARGFVFYEHDNVLVRRAAMVEVDAPAGVRFVRVDSPATVDRFIAVQLDGFSVERGDGPAMQAITRRVAEHGRSELWLLEVEGEDAGSGGLEIFEGHGTLICGAVLDRFRRRGLQGALIRHRVRRAAELGLGEVTIGSLPGGPTERNAVREGFAVAFSMVGVERR